MDERWIVLLSYWQKIKFRHALTFPFLIGALRIPVGAQDSPIHDARNELEALVKVMAAHCANGYLHHVYRCPDLGQLVVTKVIGSLPPPNAVAIPPSKLGEAPSLYASDGALKDSKAPLLSLVNAVWSEVGPAIERGLFSCKGKQFWAFNDDELRVIREALA